MKSEISPYLHPRIYDIGFSFRDYPQSVDFVEAAVGAAGLTEIDSVVELGCGPGQYCREFSRRGKAAFGVELEEPMLAYFEQLCKDEELPCKAVRADMRSFRLPQPVDLAVCMMATFCHLLTNRDTVDHFHAVADNLTDRGMYLIELPHPRDLFAAGKSTENRWTIEKDGLKVTTDWGSESKLDPLTEIEDVTVRYTTESEDKTEAFESHTQNRHISAGLVRALIENSGRFKIASMYGDLKLDQPFDDSKESWRMILVLRKHT
jgi:SAM-dependent methyltransferase